VALTPYFSAHAGRTAMASTQFGTGSLVFFALFVIGGLWIGAAEGALAGMAVRQATSDRTVDQTQPSLGPYLPRPKLSSTMRAAFVGSLPGLAVGITAGSLLSSRAPTYGRVALIQSAAAAGAVFGALVSATLRTGSSQYQMLGKVGEDPALKILPAEYSILDLSLPALIGLNVGLGAGLLGAYLPDQTRYGPSWKRIVSVKARAREKTEIYVNTAGDKKTVRGLVVICAEPRQLTLVNLVGPIDIDKLASLEGEFGIPHISKERHHED